MAQTRLRTRWGSHACRQHCQRTSGPAVSRWSLVTAMTCIGFLVSPAAAASAAVAASLTASRPGAPGHNQAMTVSAARIRAASPNASYLAWTQLSPSTVPPGRFLAAMAYDPGIRESIMVGGLSAGATLGDSWAWNGSNWAQLASAPTARQQTAMAYDPVHHDIVLFGGCGAVNRPGVGCVLGGTWVFSTKTRAWSRRHPAVSPPATLGETLAWDPV